MTQAFVEPEDLADLDVDDMYVCVAFDPGGKTGWAVFGVHSDAIDDPEYRIIDNIEFWTMGEFFGPEPEQAREMYELVEQWPTAKIIMEDFVLRKFSSARELLSPVRVCERFCGRMDQAGDKRPIIKQMPSLAMTKVTDARLKKMGLYNATVGKEHGRDAVRHCLTWLSRAKKLAEQNMVTNALRGTD